MKRKKVTAYLVSFVMIISAVVNINTPVKVFAGGTTPTGLDTPFALNDDVSVKATWSQQKETLTITGNGKIDIDKWVELSRKFNKDNFTAGNTGWNKNSYFILKIADIAVQLPDNTENVNGGFFQNFKGRIEIAKIDTSNVTNMNKMFYKAENANTDVSCWDVSNVVSMRYMFNGIDWDNLDVSTWNTSNLTDIDNMLENSFITEIDMSNWDTSKIITNKNVFSNMKNLEFLKINKLPQVSKLTAFAGEYMVENLREDGIILLTHGPYKKDKGYDLLIGERYRVYLKNTLQPRIKRVFGNNRYQTAIKASQNLRNPCDLAFVASGESIIDALTVSYASAIFKIPVFLTSKISIDMETVDEMKRLGVMQAVIIGGANVVSQNVVNQLNNNGINVNRIYGKDRYDTAVQIIEDIEKSEKIDTNKIFLCSGKTYADALSIASVTAKEGGIILLTDGNTLTDGTKAYITSDADVKIIGGNAVISNELENKIKSMGAKSVSRIYGNNRYETSLKIYNNYYKPIGVKTIYLANGDTMVDALTGTALAYKDLTGLLLTNKSKMIDSMKPVIKGMKRLRILGGSQAVQDNIWK